MTNNRKDIEDIFRKSEHRLAQRPSANAWRKLDNKLDKHRSRSRMSVVRILSMAASLIILVGAVYFFTQSRTEKKAIASAEKISVEMQPESLSELPAMEAQPILPKIEFQRKIQAGNAPIINEGPRGKKLVVLTAKKVRVKGAGVDSLKM
ncbi:MAG: hypothetical protein ACI9XO_001114 [Paraglaciecola sp.]|jgi:hypothetical protein